MEYKEVYESWLANPYFDEATKQELLSIKDDENEIKERFYADLEFGTAGLRGIIGAGTNGMNVYVVRKTTQGLAITLASRMRQTRVLPLHLTPEECLRNLPMKQPYVLQPMASRLTYLMH